MAEFDRREIDAIVNALQTIAAATSHGQRWGGGRTPPPASTSKGGGAVSSVMGALHAQNNSMLGRSISKTAEAVKLMHGSVDDFTHSLRSLTRLIPVLLGGGLIDGLVKGAMDLTRSYTRVADAGQMFGGSMLEMAAQAGASGLSLEEFTKMIERNSETAGFLQKQQSATSGSLGDLQRGVRENLKPMGFLGMSMSQVTDATGDFADTMRQEGVLGRMNEVERENAVGNMLKEVTIFSELNGRSRQETLKAFNEASRNTSLLAYEAVHTMTPAARDAKNSMLAFMAALPMGDKWANFFAEMIGHQGQTWRVGMGKVFQDTAPQVNAIMADQARLATAGIKQTPLQMIQMMEKIHDSMIPSIDLLQARDDANAQQALEYFNSTTTMINLIKEIGENAVVKNMEDQQRLMAQGKVLDRITQSFMVFENNFHILTGQFREGFYSSLQDAFMPGGATTEAMKAFGDALKGLGTIVGTVLGSFLSAFANFDSSGIVGGVQALGDWLKSWNTTISGGRTGPQQLAKDIKAVLHDLWVGIHWFWELITSDVFKNALIGIVHAIEGVANFIHNGPINNLLTGATGMSQGSADLVQLGAAYFGTKIIGSIMIGVIGSVIGSAIAGLAAGGGAAGAAFAPVILTAGAALGVLIAGLISAVLLNATAKWTAQHLVSGAAAGARSVLGVADATPEEQKKLDAIRNFSIWDRSTWADPNASWWKATPKLPDSSAPATSAAPTSTINDAPPLPDNATPGQPSLATSMASLSEVMTTMTKLMATNNDMTLSGLALQQKGNELSRGGMRAYS